MKITDFVLNELKYSQLTEDITKKQFARACLLLQNSELDVEIDNVYNEQEQSFYFQINGQCLDIVTYGVSIDVKYDVNANKYDFVSAFCECSALETERCVHQIAILAYAVNNWLIKEAISKLVSNKKLNQVASSEHILNSLASLTNASANLYQNRYYQLIPVLEVVNGDVYLKIKIADGNQKSVIVSDIYELYTAFAKNKSIEYEGKFQLQADLNNFKNSALVNYILVQIGQTARALDTISGVNASGWYNFKSSSKIKFERRKIELDDESMCNIIGMCLNQSVNFKYENERQVKYQVENFTSDLPFRVQASEQSLKFYSYFPIAYAAASENKLIFIKFGDPIIYIIDDINLVDAILLKSVLQNESIIGFQDMLSFYQTIYKRINRYIDCTYDFEALLEQLEYSKIISQLNLEGETLRVKTYLENESMQYNQEQLAIATSPYHSHLVQAIKSEKLWEYEYLICGLERVILFINEYLTTVKEASDVIQANENFANFKVKKETDIKVNIEITRVESVLQFKSNEYSEHILLKILRALAQKERYLQVDKGTYIDLSSSDLQRIKKVCEQAQINLEKIDSNEHIFNKANSFYLQQLFMRNQVLEASDQDLQTLVADLSNPKRNEIKHLEHLNTELRPYQGYGLSWLNTLQKHNLAGILADDMGLGKTIQTIALLSVQNSQLPSLIITPAALVYNWQHEICKFSDQLAVKVIDGSKKERTKQLAKLQAKCVYLTSYDLFKRDIEHYKNHTFNYVIIDEAQYIKNPNTLVAKSVKQISSHHRLALTGTPLENDLFELWSIFDFIMPNYLGSYTGFKGRYVKPIANGVNAQRDELKLKIKPFILRRLKKDVLSELPSMTESTIYVKMGDEQQRQYEAQELKIRKFLDKSDDEFNNSQIELLAMITKLRQIACNPHLVLTDYHGKIAKLDYFSTVIDGLIANNHKVVIFSQFVSNFKFIEKMLSTNQIDYYKITGQTKKDERQRLVERFNRNRIPVFLISLKAGGTGLNITGADTVIHYDPWWNKAVENQATDRVYRMGQTKNVLVYKLICEKTIEERILKMQAEKKQLFDVMIDDDKQFKLSKDDILSLFT